MRVSSRTPRSPRGEFEPCSCWAAARLLLRIHGDLQEAYSLEWNAPAMCFVSADASLWGRAGALPDSS
eukprot:2018494-Alexandrium_andersonii.AAC.1